MEIKISEKETSPENVREFLKIYNDPNKIHLAKEEGGRNILPGMYLVKILGDYSDNHLAKLGISQLEINFNKPIFYPKEISLTYEQKSQNELNFQFTNGNGRKYAEGIIGYSHKIDSLQDSSRLDLIMNLGGKLQEGNENGILNGKKAVYTYQGMSFLENLPEDLSDLELIIGNPKELTVKEKSKRLRIPTIHAYKNNRENEKIISQGFAEVEIFG